LFRTSIYHSHTVEEVLDRIEEYFEAIESGRPYYGEAGAPMETPINTEITDCSFFTS